MSKVRGQAPVTGAGRPDVPAQLAGLGADYKAPTYAAAVFGTEFTGDVNNPGDAGWKLADLSYTDEAGYTVATATYGPGAWTGTATAYDTTGKVVEALDADGLARALAAPGTEAGVYGTQTVYSPDTTTTSVAGVPAKSPAGAFVTDECGPQRTAVLPDGTTQVVRLHTHTEYDQGAPNNGVNPATGTGYGLPTTVTVSAMASTGVCGKSGDLAVLSRTFSGYDPKPGAVADTSGWKHGTATTTIEDINLNGSVDAPDATTVTYYDVEGRVTETRDDTDAATGTGPGTTLTSYYTATAQTGTNAECGNKPAWAGLVCKTIHAAQAPGAPLPDTYHEQYTMLLAPAATVETAGTITRRATTTYLPDGRTDTKALSVTGLPGSTPLPATKTLYDPATGTQTGQAELDTNSAPTGASATTVHDSWGRPVKYTSAQGDTTTTEYDAYGRVAKTTDPQGATTYTYAGTDILGRDEHRGLVTKLTVTRGDGSTLDFAGAYDLDGKLIAQDMPGQVRQETSYDEAGEPVGLTYTGQVTPVTAGTDGDGNPVFTPGTPTRDVWLAWTQINDVKGRVVREYTGAGAAFDGDPGTTNPDQVTHVAVGAATGTDRSYSYDGFDRLVRATDRRAPAGVGIDPEVVVDPAVPCQVRSYGFDGVAGKRGNRTSTTIVDHADGDCAGTTGTTTAAAYAYDVVDRPTTGANGAGAYVYDGLGRQTTIPAVDVPVPGEGDLVLGYYDDDQPRSLTRAGVTTTESRDLTGRRTRQVTGPTGQVATGTTVRHYSDSTDNPAWVTTTTPGVDGQAVEATTRYVESLADLGVQISGDGTITVTVSNLHGDVPTTVVIPAGQAASDPATSIGAWVDYQDFGQGTGDNGVVAGYGWLGAKQRATTEATLGLTLMGARLYNPRRGLFTSPDPVPGGNETSYGYPNDPINTYDLDGNSRHFRDQTWGPPCTHSTAGCQSRWPKYNWSWHKRQVMLCIQDSLWGGWRFGCAGGVLRRSVSRLWWPIGDRGIPSAGYGRSRPRWHAVTTTYWSYWGWRKKVVWRWW